ncbi:MAG: histidine phosphatase family protein [Clostridia bacterium]|nr:histidine phosphatase family protein [Clostridia bacterium]
MRIVFIRHGHPDYTRDCLTELGRKQAAAAAQRVSGEGISRIFSSTNGRALETAGFTADLLGLEVEGCDFMREISWGSLPSPWELVDAWVASGEPLMDAGWEEAPGFAANPRLLTCVRQKAEAADAWLAELGYVREGAYYRVREEVRTEVTVAAFGHGGETSAFLSRIFNLPFPFVCAACGADFTGVTIVQLPCRPGELVTPRFEIMNDARHIAGGKIAYGQ